MNSLLGLTLAEARGRLKTTGYSLQIEATGVKSDSDLTQESQGWRVVRTCLEQDSLKLTVVKPPTLE